MANGIFGNKRNEERDAIEEGLAERAEDLAEESLEKLIAEADQYAEDIEQTNLFDSRWFPDCDENDSENYDDERIDDCFWPEPIDYNQHSFEQAMGIDDFLLDFDEDGRLKPDHKLPRTSREQLCFDLAEDIAKNR